jgi:hypothetical protein
MPHNNKPISPQQLQQLARQGRKGDSMLAHINPQEAEMLKRMGGSGTINPQTGLPESCKDLVILGATYRLLSNLDPARASMVSPQADETDSKRPYGSSQSITKQVYSLFNQRLNEEVKSQQEKYPIRVHYSL